MFGRLIGLVSLSAVLLIAAVGSSAASSQRGSRDHDCSDFATQAAAQHYFKKHHPKSDPELLDGDGDGVACESNPCPCSTAGPGGGGHHVQPAKRDKAKVTSITDGDTINVHLHGRSERIRLIGIDTPEVYGGTECGGAGASAAIKRALHAGDRVKLISDPSQDNRDRYDRLLRFVERKGHDIGRRQISKGWANVYVYEGNPFKRVKEYRRAKSSARKHHRGVFGACHGHFHQAL